MTGRVNGVFGGILGKESFTLSQAFYFGALKSNPAHKVELVEGDFIDLREDLDAGAIGPPGGRRKTTVQALPDNVVALFEQNAGNGLSHDPEDLPEPVSPEKISAALAVIDPDINRQDWFAIGCALFNELGDEGFAIWNGWSSKGQKYNAKEMRGQWRSISKKNGYDFTVASVFYFADLADTQWRTKIELPPAEVVGKPEQPQQKSSKSLAAAAPTDLNEVHQTFRKWLGDEYDLDAIDAVLAAGASERLTGDPLWLLVISGPGAAKTETVQALAGAGAHVTSTIASEGALLSASPRKSRVKTATGGLLRKIGERGVLVIKDVTSILSADRNTRGSVLAAIREIYDGRWERNVGTDGGQTLTWVGRIVVIGAVTTAWDTNHTVVAAMGDRFVLIRIDSNLGRVRSGKRAIRNTSSEVQMRKELTDAVGGIVKNACTDGVTITEDEIDRLIVAADIVTKTRTAVERDFQGNVIDAHAPEMPTRFAKQLAQMVRGGVAIGMDRETAMRLALRCARDSMPPLRLIILLDIAKNISATPNEVRQRLSKPWTTVKREMEALTMLGMLQCEEEVIEADEGQKTKTKWVYSLGPDVDSRTLLAMEGEEGTPPGAVF